mgnify:CR=1 FL=1
MKGAESEIYSDMAICALEEPLEFTVMKEIISRNMTVATAESCTGGMVSARLINYPGASDAFVNGMVTYMKVSTGFWE